MPGDLHCHTKLSRGSLGIDDLIILAKKVGINTIAITDQDTMGMCHRGKIVGDRYDVTVVHGVKISCTHPESGKEMAILCYLPDAPDRLESLCRENLLVRAKLSQRQMLQIMQRFPVTPELIKGCAKGSVCCYPEHMMYALMECGAADILYGELYQELFTCGGKRSINFRAVFKSPFEVLDAIRHAGGISVLAHPEHDGAVDLLDALVRHGLDGVEVYHRENNEATRQRLLHYAAEHELLITGGSDFRGFYNNGKISIGGESVSDTQVNALLTYKIRKRRKKAPQEDEAALKLNA
jgi:predicted metal-dependent phosphoesterase TrpH